MCDLCRLALSFRVELVSVGVLSTSTDVTKSYHAQWIEVALLPAERNPHLEVVVIVIIIDRKLIDVAQPGMPQHVWDRDSLLWLYLKQAFDEVQRLI